MDLINQLVVLCQDYLNDTIGTDEFRAQMQRLVSQFNANEFKAIAHVLSQYAMHLRDRH